MNKERKPTFNYILNDMALLSLLIKCLYSEYPSEQDKYDLEYQVKLLLENETKLKKEKYKIIEYIVKNCILSDEWTELDFCHFIPTGKITYKQLTPKKVKELLELLGDKENE